MHSLHRQLDERYKSAIQMYNEIYGKNQILEKNSQILEKDYNGLKASKIENDNKVVFNMEQIQQLNSELQEKTNLRGNNNQNNSI